MLTQVGVLSRSVTSWAIVLGVFAILASGCSHVWAGKPPPCPPPSDAAIEDVAELIDENEQNPGMHSMLLIWVAELARYCAALGAMRSDGD